MRTKLAGAVVLFAVAAFPHPVASRTLPPADVERDCQELVPAAYSAPVLSEDDGHEVSYDVRVLLDGIGRKRARSLVDSAQAPYTAHGIELHPTFSKIARIQAGGTYGTRPAAEVSYLFAKTREAVGGERPEGTDAVLLLSDKAFYAFTDADGDGYADESEREYGSIGEAACAGA